MAPGPCLSTGKTASPRFKGLMLPWAILTLPGQNCGIKLVFLTNRILRRYALIIPVERPESGDLGHSCRIFLR